MRQNNEKKHIGLKIVLALAVAFFLFIAVSDFSPSQETVEKTISYTDIQSK